MGDHDHPGAPLAERPEGGKRRPDATVVDDDAVLHGDIEIDTDQDAPPGYRDVVDGRLHG
jgi:hypothetical protein